MDEEDGRNFTQIGGTVPYSISHRVSVSLGSALVATPLDFFSVHPFSWTVRQLRAALAGPNCAFQSLAGSQSLAASETDRLRVLQGTDLAFWP